MLTFEPGELVMYVRDNNASSCEIGRVLRRAGDESYFVFYHAGETASCTHVRNLRKLDNAFTVTATTLGGERAARELGTL